MKPFRATLLLMTAALVLSSCTSRALPPAFYGSPDSPRKVLMAADSSAYKNAVTAQAAQDLAARNVYVESISLRDLKNRNPSDYEAVVLVNTLMAWTMAPEVAAFLKRAEHRKRIVLLTTAGNPDWKADTEGVDAVTAASQSAESGAMAQDIVDKVEKILGM